MRAALLALPLVCACAAAPAPARCPAPPATHAVAARAAEPAPGPAVTELLARLPDGSDVLARVDLQRAMETRLGRILAPLGVWSQGYARTRLHCGERPWEQLRAVEAVYRSEAFAAALLGPVADEGNACAPAAMEVRTVDELRAREAGGGTSLVLGQGPIRDAMVAARGGEDTARDDEAFQGLPPGMPDALATILVRGRAWRQFVATMNQAAEEVRREQAAEGTPLPELAFASDAALEALRGARVELGLSPTGDLDVRMSMLFRSPEAARRYVEASDGDMRERLPAFAAELVTREMRGNPDARRAADGFRTELGAWLAELSPLAQRGPVVEVTFAPGSGSSVAVLGVLSAVAIPAFTRYVKRSKTAEAMHNVSIISGALITELNGLAPARRRAARLTPAPATPSAAPGTQKYAADVSRWAAPAWQRIGFSIDADHYYQYRVDVDGRCYVVVAEGDLDGDGTRSNFSRRVCPGPDGTYAAGEVTITNELE